MCEIELDAKDWNNYLDFHDGLLRAAGAPSWHGKNVNALIDSMLWDGVNTLESPYTIRIKNIKNLPADIKDELTLAQKGLAVGREDFRLQEGHDVGVSFELLS